MPFFPFDQTASSRCPTSPYVSLPIIPPEIVPSRKGEYRLAGNLRRDDGRCYARLLPPLEYKTKELNGITSFLVRKIK